MHSQTATDACSPGQVDRNWHIGVCGWQSAKGAPIVPLREVLTDADNPDKLIEEHKAAILWLELVLAKLQWELDNALEE